MKPLRLAALTAILILTAACSDKAQEQPAAATPPAAQAPALQPAAYETVTQQIYLTYFGRAADAGGLSYYEEQLAASGAPTALNALVKAYKDNPKVSHIIDTFANSDESKQLYAGDSKAFITSVYRNLFNRAPDAAGLDYWAGSIDKGEVTRVSAALNIMSSAQGSDVAILNAKTSVARSFTASLDSDAKRAAYGGDKANAEVRKLLAAVATEADAATFQDQAKAALDKLPAPK